MRRFIRTLSSLLVSVFLTTVLISFPLLADPTDIDCLSVSTDHDFSASTNVVSTWPSHANVEFTFTNTGSNKIENWYIIFDTPYTIENIWNGSIVESDNEDTYTICGANWNRDIEVGSSVTVGMTLASEDGSDITNLPNRFILNSAREIVSPDSYSITYVEYSRWEDGFNGVLTIRANETIEDWELTFVSSEPITQASGALLSSDNSGCITFTNDGNSQDIEKDSPYTIFIQGNNTTGYLELTDIVMTTVKKAYAISEDDDENGVPDYLEAVGITPTPEPTVTPGPTVTTEPTLTTAPMATITSTPTATLSPTSTDTPTPTAVIVLPTISPTNTPTPTDTPVPTVTATVTPTPTVTEEDLLIDTDGDGLFDILEEYMGYNPNVPDSNADGIPDGDEDYDNDGLTNTEEVSIGTLPIYADSDNDDISDGEEVHIYQTDPLNCDTDDDTVDDNEEIWIGKDPNDPSDGQTLVTQTVSGIINNPEDQFITSVDITMAVNDYLDYDVYSEDLYGIDSYSTGVYGRRGSPIGLNSYVDFDTATITLHYNEEYLEGTNEEDLGLLWYDEENGIYIEQDQAVVDTDNNTITAELDHFSTYVPVDLAEWNEPIIPDNTDYVRVDDYGTVYISWPGQEPDIAEMEHDCFVWWSLSERYDYVKLATLSASKSFEPTGRVMEHWHYDFVWLLMAEDDEDEDGVPDILERNGVMGLDRRIYQSRTDRSDSDGDGIPDVEEYGNIYTLYRYSEENYCVLINTTLVYDNGQLTDLSPADNLVISQLLLITNVGESNSIAVMNSDPQSSDSDHDGVNDTEDGAPLMKNGLINYLIVGEDSEGGDEVSSCAEHYSDIYQEEHMRFYTIKPLTRKRFFVFWTNLDRFKGSFYVFPAGPCYSGVDNCIFVCHGNESALYFSETEGIATYTYWDEEKTYSDLIIMGSELSNHQMHINCIDLQACNCADLDHQYDNIAYQMAQYFNVTEVFGWDTESYYESYCRMNYYMDPTSDGYVKYSIVDGSIHREPNVDELTDMDYYARPYLSFFEYFIFVKPKLHSFASQR